MAGDEPHVVPSQGREEETMTSKQQKQARRGTGLFVKRALKSPRQMAAFGPSTPAVSRAVARQVDLTREGVVLELGGGTGSITQALLEHGVEPRRLVVVERYPELCELLRSRFPGVRVVEGDVMELGDLLAELGISSVACVVSSVPLVWMSLRERRQIVEQVFDLMDEEGRLVQLTYSPVSPLPKRRLGLEGELVARVMLNAPPAAVWVFRKRR